MFQVHVVNKNNNMVVLNSTPFNTKREAENLMESMISLKDKYLFILNTLSLPSQNNYSESIYSSLNEPYEKSTDDELNEILDTLEDNSHEGDLEGLRIIKCGRGLFIQPYKGHKDYGEKYYHNGWWMANGWFFKKEFYQGLINQGAIPNQEVIDELGFPERQNITNYNKSSDNNSDSNSENSDDYQDFQTNNNLKGFKLDKYKKGLFIKCPLYHSDYGKKYYHNGWWMKEREGWFFKVEEYQNLIDMGAEATKRLLSYKFLNMTYSIYDEDYYQLECFKNNKYYKQKFFEGGVWNNDIEGWLFSRSKFGRDFFKNNLTF